MSRLVVLRATCIECGIAEHRLGRTLHGDAHTRCYRECMAFFDDNVRCRFLGCAWAALAMSTTACDLPPDTGHGTLATTVTPSGPTTDDPSESDGPESSSTGGSTSGADTESTPGDDTDSTTGCTNPEHGSEETGDPSGPTGDGLTEGGGPTGDGMTDGSAAPDQLDPE